MGSGVSGGTFVELPELFNLGDYNVLPQPIQHAHSRETTLPPVFQNGNTRTHLVLSEGQYHQRHGSVLKSIAEPICNDHREPKYPSCSQGRLIH